MTRKIERLPVGTVVKVSHTLATARNYSRSISEDGLPVFEKTYDRNLVRRKRVNQESVYAWIVGETQKSSGNVSGYPDEGTSYESKETVMAYRIRFNQRGKEYTVLPIDIEVVEGIDPEKEFVNAMWDEKDRNMMKEVAREYRCSMCGRFTATSGVLCKMCHGKNGDKKNA